MAVPPPFADVHIGAGFVPPQCIVVLIVREVTHLHCAVVPKEGSVVPPALLWCIWVGNLSHRALRCGAIVHTGGEHIPTPCALLQRGGQYLTPQSADVRTGGDLSPLPCTDDPKSKGKRICPSALC